MIIPLFPLPHAVLFPKTPLPLGIFEERYRTMIQDAMGANRELAVVLLRDEAETGYTGLDSVHEIACMGRIESFDEQGDGKYHIVVVGLCRVRIIQELQQSPYPMVEVEKIEEIAHDEYSDVLIARHNHIGGLFARFVELATDGNQDAREITPRMEFESLVNTVAMTLNISVEQKQDLLETDDVFLRCDVLLGVLQQQIETLELIHRFEHLKPENPHWN